MAENAHTKWYRLGTVSVENGSKIVTGSGTRWTTGGINRGATFRIDNLEHAYEVVEIISDTELELFRPYQGESGEGLFYSIDRNFQSTQNAQLAAQLAYLAGEYEQVFDGHVLTINGKSAYQLALEHGFEGTEEEYLEMLKGGGEIVAFRNDLRDFNRKLTKSNEDLAEYQSILNAMNWRIDENYKLNDTVFYKSNIYVCKEAHISSEEMTPDTGVFWRNAVIDNAEIVNARTDEWGKTHAKIGDNIRDAQHRLAIGLRDLQEYQDAQFNELASSLLDVLFELKSLKKKQTTQSTNL